MLSILLNTIVLALTWFDEPDAMVTTTEILNYIFLGIFTIEAILKIIAMRKAYFTDGWNLFDFTIVVLTLVFLFFGFSPANIGFRGGPSVLRALRIGRILKLLKRLQSLQIIFMTLAYSATSLGSLGLLLIMFFFMFAIIGRAFFSFA